MDGEDKTSVAPEVGDSVDGTFTGTVTRIEGDNAYITVETVNDQPLPDSAEPEPDEAAMRGMAATADAEPMA
jgi:hypothetical protein